MSHKTRKILIACPERRAGNLSVLLDAYQSVGIQTAVHLYTGNPQASAIDPALLNSTDALLVLGDGCFAPGTVLQGPFVSDATGRRLPGAWFPLKDEARLERFASTIRQVHNRGRQKPGLAMLSQWHPRYLQLSDRVETILKGQIQTFRWTSDVIGRNDVVQALGSGLGMGLYVGHGRPLGWVGYYGMRAHHFDSFSGSPMGCVLSLCCRTASRRRNGLSYTEALPTMGISAASFGAIRETRHTDNTRWIVRICESLLQGADNLADLLLDAAPSNPESIQYYRIVGDPLVPLYTDLISLERAESVKTYA